MRRREVIERPTPTWAVSPAFVGLTDAELCEVTDRITREVKRKFEYKGRHRA